jgi:hypothetical protein
VAGICSCIVLNVYCCGMGSGWVVVVAGVAGMAMWAAGVVVRFGNTGAGQGRRVGLVGSGFGEVGGWSWVGNQLQGGWRRRFGEQRSGGGQFDRGQSAHLPSVGSLTVSLEQMSIMETSEVSDARE